MGNEPLVGIVGTVNIHFGMLGHGSFFTGGDRDIALTRSVIGGDDAHGRGVRVEPAAARGRLLQARRSTRTTSPGFEEDVARVDQADGKLDGSGATTRSTSC